MHDAEPITDARAIELLEGVLARTGDAIAEVTPAQRSLATPCPNFDVAALVDHIVGWVRVFAAGSADRPFEGDPGEYRAGDDAGTVFRTAADELVGGWRTYGLDREVRSFAGGMMPGRMIFGMTVMEYLAHGWDLAAATGHDPEYDDAAAQFALASANEILLPEYRGTEFFGNSVEVPADAPALDRFLGFVGRDPAWRPTGA